jgi:quercetin dioxygenase-like cupin family protein
MTSGLTGATGGCARDARLAGNRDEGGRHDQSCNHRGTAQVPGIERTDLQQHDLSIPGRIVIQNRVTISPEAPAVRHKHPGEEIIYIVEGVLEYSIDGQEPRTYEAGEALMVPAEKVHSVRAVGGGGTELATYVVEKDKPFIVLAD